MEDDPIDCDFIQHLSKSARRAGIRVLFPEPKSLPSKMPEATAKKVLSDCGNHCEQLVAICEQAYATTVAKVAPKVAQLADSDGWFTGSD